MKENNVFSKIGKGIKDILITGEVFWKNEIDANMLLARVMIFSSLVLVITNVLNYFGVYMVPSRFLNAITLQGLLELLIPAGLCYYYKGQKQWLKWLMIIMLTFVYARVYTAISYRTAILMVLPVVLSCRYYSKQLTVTVSTITTIVFLLAAIFSKSYGSVDMNNVASAAVTEISVPVRTILLRSFLPSYILFWIASIAAYNIAFRGRNMILDQDKISQEQSRVETELTMAKKIQERALPLVPDLPFHKEYELSASMTTAKEVGGDFYDFMFVDPTHLAIVVADVSGKGVPAALFMMVSKILISSRIMMGGTPGDILKDVNNQLCAKKLDDMFVTVWLGIIDLTNGHVITANAGHEYPVIKRGEEDFTLFKDKHGLFLGGIPDMEYVESEFDLAPGDSIFLYTDGVPEANNAERELYGMDRMLGALNKHKSESTDSLIIEMKNEIDNYADESEQFDDITMVAFHLNSFMQTKESEE